MYGFCANVTLVWAQKPFSNHQFGFPKRQIFPFSKNLSRR